MDTNRTAAAAANTPARRAWAPASALAITAKNCAAVAYVGTRDTAAGETLPFAVIFTGRCRKPARASGTYRSEAARNKAVASAFEGQARAEARRAKSRAEAKASRKAHTLTVGSVLVASWGYEQTNVDAYEVTKVSGSMVTVCKIHTRTVSSSTGINRVAPAPGSFVDGAAPMRRRVRSGGDSVRINDSASAYQWDGESSFCATAHGWGH
jgi:hypothetical protein